MNSRVAALLTRTAALVLTAGLLSACATPFGALFRSSSPTNPPPTPEPDVSEATIPTTRTPTLLTPASENPCGIAAIVVPTAAPDPGYVQLDPSTGLHVTGKLQLLDLDTWRLRVTGKVEQPLDLTYDQIRCLPKVNASPDLICPGFFVDQATWAGAAIADVLALARPLADATEVEFVAADGYHASMVIEFAMDRVNFLAYEWRGQPLPRLHGFPLRVVRPREEGNLWIKWVIEMRVQ